MARARAAAVVVPASSQVRGRGAQRAAPLADGVRGAAELPGQRLVALAGRRAEDDLGPQGQRLRAGRAPQQRGQHRLLGRR